MAGWSVHTNADSTVTLTAREITNPDQLRTVLAEAGITARARVYPVTGDSCRLPAHDCADAEPLRVRCPVSNQLSTESPRRFPRVSMRAAVDRCIK